MNLPQHVIRHSLCALLMMGMLGACVHPTRVQIDYIGQRDDCRSLAENNQDLYIGDAQGGNSVLDAKDRNAVLAKIFSDCMFLNGWTVASPPSQTPREQEISAADDDLEFLSTPSYSTQTRAAASRQGAPSVATPPPADRKPVNGRTVSPQSSPSTMYVPSYIPPSQSQQTAPHSQPRQ